MSTVAFLCENSAAPALAALEAQPGDSRFIEVPCSGRVDVTHLLDAVESGATRVVVLACHDGVCRYLDGNRFVEKKIARVRALLAEVGCTVPIECHRVAANQPGRLAEILAQPVNPGGDAEP